MLKGKLRQLPIEFKEQAGPGASAYNVVPYDTVFRALRLPVFVRSSFHPGLSVVIRRLDDKHQPACASYFLSGEEHTSAENNQESLNLEYLELHFTKIDDSILLDEHGAVNVRADGRIHDVVDFISVQQSKRIL